MAKTVLRLQADRQTLREGSRAEVLALLAQFKSPSTAVDSRTGETVKLVLFGRFDSLNVVEVAREAGMALEPSDYFNSTRIAGNQIDDYLGEAILKRLKALEKAGVPLDKNATNQSSETLIQHLAHAFYPEAMEFLEARGFDPLAKNANGQSAFSIVLQSAQQEEGVASFNGSGQMGGLLAMAQAQAQHTAHGALSGLQREGFGQMLKKLEAAARQEGQAQEKKTRWLEQKVEMGAQVPAQKLLPTDPLYFFTMLSAKRLTGGSGAAPSESALGARLEAAQLRREVALSAPAPAAGKAAASANAIDAAPSRQKRAPRL